VSSKEIDGGVGSGMTENQIRFFDLFGGIGGFRLGLEAASNRYRCVGYSDKDKYAVKSYNEIFEEEHEPSDISEVEPGQLPDFDLLCGGFPCQAFSVAGNREGFEDTRGTLFFEICRIARAKRPEVLLLENVKGLLSHNEGETFRTILASLDELGYDAEWQVLNSKHWGVPQNRERVFIVASLREQSSGQIFPIEREDGEDSGEDEEKIIRWQNKDAGAVLDSKAPSLRASGVTDIRKMPKVAEGLNTTEDGSSFCLDKNYNKSFSADWMINRGGRTHIINHQMRPESRPSIQEEGQSGGSGILFNSEYSYALSSSPHFVSEQADDRGKIRVHRDDDKKSEIQGYSAFLPDADYVDVVDNHDKNLVQPCITPRRINKRQNGRRLKEGGEPMFSLTGQDIHAVCGWRTALYHGRGFEVKDEPISHAVKGAEGGYSKNFATDGVRIRKLTPRECWRLQGFPDWAFDRAEEVNSDTQLYRQAGNAVTVNVIEKLGVELLRSFDIPREGVSA